MPMSLTNLPLEVFNCVIANIEPQGKGEGEDGGWNEMESGPALLDLCNLAQCSRQCYIWTMPHLYRHVTVYEKTPKQHGRLRNLASFLIQRPDLAPIVRSFTLHFDEYSSDDGTKVHKSQNSDVHVSSEIVKVDPVFETAVNAFGLSEEEEYDWLSKLDQNQKCHPDLILGLLLPTLLNLGKIVLDLKTYVQSPHLHRVLRRAVRREKPFDTQPPFEALRVFMLSHDTLLSQDMFSLRSTSHIASLLKLPAIQIISGGFENSKDCYDCIVDEDKSLIELDNSSSPLTSLDLAACKLSAVNLGHILRAPKALKTFSYTLCPHVSDSFTDICQALRPQENFLESISIDHNQGCEERIRVGAGAGDDYGPMKSFIGFSTLKVFKIPALLLHETNYGTSHDRLINIFPPSLETLHLTGFRSIFTELLKAVEHLLAKESPQQLPLLKKFVLKEHESSFRRKKLKDVLWRDTQETAIGRLSRVAAARGVSFDVILNDKAIMRRAPRGWFQR